MKLNILCLPCLAILCFSPVLTGCVDMAPVGEFANGAEALSEASGKFYQMTLDTDLSLAGNTVMLNPPKEVKEACLDEKLDTNFKCQLNSDNLLKETRRNRAAIMALNYYAQSLKAMAEFNDDAQIEQASKELGGNLQSLSNELGGKIQGLAKDVADPQDSVLANAISSLGKLYIDLKVQQAVFEKTKLAQPAVTTIINTFVQDIKRQIQGIRVNRNAAYAAREKRFNAFSEEYKRKDITAAQRELLNIQAGDQIREELADRIAFLPSQTFLDGLIKTADSCLKAHEAIQQPNLKDRAQIIGGFVNDAKGLLSSMKR